MNCTGLALLAAAAGMLAACDTSDSDSAANSATQQTSSTSSIPTASGTGLTAWQVVDSFIAAGLPAPNPRDNSGNCTGDGGLGCVQLITTDAISVYSWRTEATAQHQVDVAGGGAYRKGLIVLSYVAARTPEADRPRYEAVLNQLLGS